MLTLRFPATCPPWEHMQHITATDSLPCPIWEHKRLIVCVKFCKWSVLFHIENSSNWLSVSFSPWKDMQLIVNFMSCSPSSRSWEHLQLIVNVMSLVSAIITPAWEHLNWLSASCLALVSVIITVQLENTCNWLSTSCLAVGQRHHPAWEHQLAVQLENTCNWLSTSCLAVGQRHHPAWEHLQLIVNVMSCSLSAPSSRSSLRTPATDCQRHI